MEKLNEKLTRLKEYLTSLESVAIAFSGGVDSTFLLKVARDVLGDRVIAVTARSCSFPERELNEARRFAAENGIAHYICDSEELDIEGFSSNPPNRCYLCKKELFTKIRRIADEHGIKHVAEGSNLDDDGDYRPGLTAVAELGVKSPLRYARLTKEEIRDLSRDMELGTWNKQSFACLSSRFVYGEKISREGLKRVELSEQLLLDMGFRQVRVRTHGDLARIEVSAGDIPRLIEPSNASIIHSKLKEYGFTYVSLDLAGYRTGSMNDTLKLSAEASAG